MPEIDPYGDPYASATPTDALPPISDPGAANAAASQAGYFANLHRGAISGREKEIRDIQEKQQLNVNTMTQMLDDTVAQIKRARDGRSSLPMLEMAGAMMSTPGNFGQQVGAGFTGLARGVRAQREEDSGTDLKIADLNLKRATIANAPLETRLAYMKALQTGDIAALARIEAMQVKAQAGGADPAVVKEWRQWQQQPGNENKPLSEYQTFKAGLTDRGTAKQREFNLWEADPKNKGRSYEDFLRDTASATAGGKAQGTAQGTAVMGLPELVNNSEVMLRKIEQILNMPNLDSLLGWGSVIPNRPGGPGKELENMLAELKSQGYLAGFERMKGAGAITDKEGEIAQNALMRLDPSTDPKVFKKQLEEAKDKIARGVDVLRQKAGKDPAKETLPAPGSPSPPGQTSQTPKPPGAPSGTYTGPRAKAADGSPLIVRDGKWVPE